MTTLHLIKSASYFLPADAPSEEAANKFSTGAYLEAKVTQPRNPAYHRKLFAMLGFAFEYFEPEGQEWHGVKAQKNFERFRKDVLILAGYRIVTYNIKGEVRVEAESISFASMDETRFQEVYKACFNVCWELVLSKVQGMTKDEAEQAINKLLAFD